VTPGGRPRWHGCAVGGFEIGSIIANVRQRYPVTNVPKTGGGTATRSLSPRRDGRRAGLRRTAKHRQNAIQCQHTRKRGSASLRRTEPRVDVGGLDHAARRSAVVSRRNAGRGPCPWFADPGARRTRCSAAAQALRASKKTGLSPWPPPPSRYAEIWLRPAPLRAFVRGRRSAVGAGCNHRGWGLPERTRSRVSAADRRGLQRRLRFVSGLDANPAIWREPGRAANELRFERHRNRDVDSIRLRLAFGDGIER